MESEQSSSTMTSQGVSSRSVTSIYRDRLAWLFLLAAAWWGLLAAIASSCVTAILLQPELMANQFSFAHLHSLPNHLLVFAFAANGLFAAIYFSTQRLCQRAMWSESLGMIHWIGWQLVCMWIASTLLTGHKEARYGQELLWPIDLAIVALWMIFAWNLLATIAYRRSSHVYISLWFYVASAIGVIPIHLLSNLVTESTGYASTSLYAGVQDGFLQSWGASGLLMFAVIIPFTGVMYYFVPRISGQPVANHRMAIIQFWAMISMGTLMSARWLQGTAVPEWIGSVAMLASLVMFLPCWGGVMNGLSMVKGARTQGHPNALVLSYFWLGILLYGWLCIEIVLTSTKFFNAWTAFTDWQFASGIGASVGFAGLMIVGVGQWMVSMRDSSHKANAAAQAQFWIVSVAVCLFVFSHYAIGFAQGYMAMTRDGTGTLIFPEYIEIVTSVANLRWFAVGTGAFLAVAFLWVGIAWMQKFVLGSADPVQELAQVNSAEDLDQPPPQSSLEGQAVLNLGIKLDVWSTLHWHLGWERQFVKLFTCAVLVILLGVTIEAAPSFFWTNAANQVPEPISYTPLELTGREIFIREGCTACHSQTVRPLVAETARYGDFTTAGLYRYDRPALWGGRRIGPDLAREGGRQNGFWHWQHLQNPRSVNPGSLMPSYDYLLTNPLEMSVVAQLVAREAARGVPYPSEWLPPEATTADSEEVAGEESDESQDALVSGDGESDDSRASQAEEAVFVSDSLREAVQSQAEVVAADIVKSGGPAARMDIEATALIAYLQRLGNPPEIVSVEAP